MYLAEAAPKWQQQQCQWQLTAESSISSSQQQAQPRSERHQPDPRVQGGGGVRAYRAPSGNMLSAHQFRC
jgi:hypothetical protein